MIGIGGHRSMGIPKFREEIGNRVLMESATGRMRRGALFNERREESPRAVNDLRMSRACHAVHNSEVEEYNLESGVRGEAGKVRMISAQDLPEFIFARAVS